MLTCFPILCELQDGRRCDIASYSTVMMSLILHAVIPTKVIFIAANLTMLDHSPHRLYMGHVIVAGHDALACRLCCGSASGIAGPPDAAHTELCTAA